MRDKRIASVAFGIVVVALIVFPLTAQPVERAGWISIGISPSFLVEPYDEHDNTLEVNILPFTFEFGISDVWAIEFRPIVNLRFKPNEPVSISHVGISVTTPRYVDIPWLSDTSMTGIVGPVATYAYNLQDKTHSLTLAGEVGISAMLSQSWVLDAMVQPGATFVWDSDGSLMPVIPHIGVFVIPAYRFPTR